MVIGDHLDGAMDEIRIRNISGFPGLPTARYNAEEGTWLLYQFDYLNYTLITDNSGQNNSGTINGTAAYETDVYGGGVEEEQPKGLKLVSTAATLLQVKFVLDMFLKE